jgi:hypothetical protein
MPRSNSDFYPGNRKTKVYRPTDRHGNSRFTVHGINRRIGVSPRGGYQGPDTRGQISRSLGAAGGGTTSMQGRDYRR